MMKKSIKLRVMTKNDFDAYALRAIPLLAEAQAKAYGTTIENSLASAEAAFRKIVPDEEPAATAQHLYVVEAGGVSVGAVWFDIRQAGDDTYLYLYDWVIWPEYRGQGFGKASMQMIEQHARENSAGRLMLNVFSHNRFAFDLYRNYGFTIASSILVKRIDGR